MDGFGWKARSERKPQTRSPFWELVGLAVLLLGIIALAVAGQN